MTIFVASHKPLPRSTFELLFRAARLVNERAVTSAREAGATSLRLAHTQLFPHIAFEGTRMTEIARRLDVTKQAIGPLVDDLVAAGMVERIADPSDQRAKLIRWTRRGRRALEHGLGVLARLEREIAATVGPTRMAALADTLDAVIAALDDIR
ncbi:MAG: MarR family winged helix-turn-helix transcriptional regulator [bacterium]